MASVPLEGPPKDQRRDRGGELPHGEALAVRSLWKRLGFPPELLPEAVALSPVEGLEHLDTKAVPVVLRRAVDAAGYLEEAAAEDES